MAPPTNRTQFFKKHGIKLTDSLTVEQIAKLSGMPFEALEEVRKRGRGAYANNLASVRVKGTFVKNPSASIGRPARLSINQWSFARIYSFVNYAKGTFYGADADIAKKYNIVEPK
jgi:transposase